MKLLATKVYFLTFMLSLSPHIYAKQAHKNEPELVLSSLTSHQESEKSNKDREKLRSWMAGETIGTESIKRFGIKNCFCQQPIDKTLFNRIYNKSYKADCTIPLTDLRYLKVLHYDINKHIRLGELICHKDISRDLLNIFKALFEAQYPIERMVLIDNYNAEDELSMQDNNTSCFNFRRVSGTKTLSNHSTGHAIDINPLYNPYIKTRRGKTIVQPQLARKYSDREKIFPYKIKKGDLCYRLFKKYGFKWGGEWKSVKDYQHFEKDN